jgi:uncharacterized membrane protein YphA (DoxX/SURF4 family)
MAHVVQRRETASYARSLGTPAADVGTVLTNAFVHRFWALEDPMERMTQMTNFMKNTALAGAALVLFYVAIELEDGIGIAIEPALFD